MFNFYTCFFLEFGNLFFTFFGVLLLHGTFFLNASLFETRLLAIPRTLEIVPVWTPKDITKAFEKLWFLWPVFPEVFDFFMTGHYSCSSS
jgi:hypothetical protein